MPLKIIADQCTACGLCPAICPRAFQMSADGSVAEVIDADAQGSDVDDAIASCPTGAIVNE